MRAFAILIAALAVTACLRQTSYQCSSDSDCGDGSCELVGYCSFADPGCDGGRRFGGLSGTYANQCVGGGDLDGGVDSPIDAPPMCPAGYTMNGATAYRLVTTGAAWAAAELDCGDDGFGTHLAVVADVGEETRVDTISTASRTWVGISDRKIVGTWRWVTGATGPVIPASGTAGNCGQWYDATGGGTARLQNRDCATAYAYLCECDLIPPDPNAF